MILKLCCVRVDLRKFLLISNRIERHALRYAFSRSCTLAASSVGSRSARVYSTAMALASALLVSLAKIVAVDGRRKTEADDETQERNGPVSTTPESWQDPTAKCRTHRTRTSTLEYSLFPAKFPLRRLTSRFPCYAISVEARFHSLPPLITQADFRNTLPTLRHCTLQCTFGGNR